MHGTVAVVPALSAGVVRCSPSLRSRPPGFAARGDARGAPPSQPDSRQVAVSVSDHWGVAQLVERLTLAQEVAGSSPASPATHPARPGTATAAAGRRRP